MVVEMINGNWKNIQKHKWKIILIFFLCLQVLLVLYYGNQKAGYHEDEYYSYYSTNRTSGLFEPDREWVDSDTYRKEFVTLKGDRFHYGLVSTVQSWDVHPPLFYFILHTACSLFPGVFSKWLGIGVNLVAFTINFFLLAWLTYRITGKNKVLTVLVSAVHGFNAVIISGVLFIRMYEWLTLFVLLCACIHVRAVQEEDFSWRRFLLPVMAVNYLGFLTQYYYIIFLFFMAAGTCVWLLWRDRKLLNCIKYGICCGVSLIAAVISYPACLSHIFRGYRGTGAAAEFLDTANTGDRLRFFTGLLNDYVFDGMLPVWLLAIGGMAVILLVRKPRKAGKEEMRYRGEGRAYFLLLFAACGYFFTVSKTALLLYETSNRYQLPIYGILMMLLITTVCTMADRIVRSFAGSNTIRKGILAVLFLLFMLGDLHELASGKVLFLYQEDAARVQYAKENADVPVIVLYNEVTPYHVWWCSEELMQYPKVYFASEANKERITDDTICTSDKIIVYAADYDTKEESLEMILDSNPNIKGYRMVSEKSLWSVYEFQ